MRFKKLGVLTATAVVGAAIISCGVGVEKEV
jgi:hypothetical protein